MSSFINGNIISSINTTSSVGQISILNSGLVTDGSYNTFVFGKSQTAYNCSYLGHMTKTTTANSYGYLVQHQTDETSPTISWKSTGAATGVVGINQAPGTEALEVTGNTIFRGNSQIAPAQYSGRVLTIGASNAGERTAMTNATVKIMGLGSDRLTGYWNIF